MTKIQNNRLRDVVVVPHSPAPELNIMVIKERFAKEDRWKAYLKDRPEIWETGSTWSQAVGYLMVAVMSHDDNVKIEIQGSKVLTSGTKGRK